MADLPKKFATRVDPEVLAAYLASHARYGTLYQKLAK